MGKFAAGIWGLARLVGFKFLQGEAFMIFGRYINKFYLKYAHMLLLGLAALILVDFFQLKVPEFYRMVINGVNEGVVEIDGQIVPFDKTVVLKEICLPLILVIVAMVIGRFLWRICFFGAGIKVETSLRNQMFNHSKELSQEYYQVNKVGNLMSLYTNDLDTINECFGDGVLMFFDAVFLGGLALVKMWRMDHLLTLLTLIPLSIMLAIGAIVGKNMEKKWDERQAAFSKLSDFAQESFSGIAVIKAFVKEFVELYSFKKLNKEHEKANVVYTKVSTLLHILITLLIESVICIILGYGGYLVYQDRFDVGQLMEYIGYFNSIVWPVMAISMLIEKTSRGKASLKRITELLDSPITVCDKDGAKEVEVTNGKIEFKNLSFRYPGGEFDVLEDLSFTINAGESVGIVGKTGAGKTTLVDLILRIHNVKDGTLFVDGHDVNDITIESVRRACAYVPQDNFLFSDTIENNIGFAFDEISHERVEENAKFADIHGNIVEFQKGYDTMLGERGVTVSGGQKQRISIARALIRNSPILILDDSVSAVDTKTERVILDNLQKSRKGKTTLLIAHRITTVEKMDKIIFIEDGRIVAVGPHDRLVETCPSYQKMVELQRLEDEEGGEVNA